MESEVADDWKDAAREDDDTPLDGEGEDVVSQV